jgi:hypothetical protein
VFESSVLRKFRPKKNEIKGDWRKQHNEGLNDLYCSHNIVRVIKTRRMRWVGHVARTGERRVQGFGGETCGKETTWKTQSYGRIISR